MTENRIASICMYAASQQLIDATDSFWAFVRDGLRMEGVAGVPDRLDRTLSHDVPWLMPNLLLSQTCGYPYVSQLREKVRLVATPIYDFPGCGGPNMCSFIVVHRDASAQRLEELRGSRAAINSTDSNSGMNLLRATIAPLARSGRFFSQVIETGGHVSSIKAVAAKKADVAAIDCITFGNIMRFAPELLAEIRVLAETVKGPGLPLITRGTATDAEVEALRGVLLAAIDDPGLEPVRSTLGLTGMALLSDEDYQPLLELERTARALGYPRIA